MDIRIQRGRIVLSGTALSGTAAISGVDTTKAFVRVTGFLGPHGVWGVSGAQTEAQNREFGARPYFVNSGLVGVARTGARAGAGNRTSYDFEVWEYVGDPGGANEFLVRNFSTVTLGTVDTSANLTISGVTSGDAPRILPILCGVQNDIAGIAFNLFQHTLDVRLVSGALVVRAEREIAFFDTAVVTIAALHLTGSNWSDVQQLSGVYPHTSGAIPVAFPLNSAVDWEHTALFVNARAPGAGPSSTPYMAFPGSNVQTQVSGFDTGHWSVVKYLAPAAGNYTHVAHVVSNPDMVVDHIHSDLFESVFGGTWSGTGEDRIPAQSHVASVALASGSVPFLDVHRPARSAPIVAAQHYGAGLQSATALLNRLMAGYQLSGSDAAGFYWAKDNVTASALEWGLGLISFYTTVATSGVSGVCTLGAGATRARGCSGALEAVINMAPSIQRVRPAGMDLEVVVTLAGGFIVPCDWYDSNSPPAWFSAQSQGWFDDGATAGWYSTRSGGWFDDGGGGWFDAHEC